MSNIPSEDKPDFEGPFGTHPERNWEEDYAHENGNYINTCGECGLSFRGHKRRVRCKKCMTPNWAELAKKVAPHDNKCAHAGCWADGEMTGYARCMVNGVEPLRLKISKLEQSNRELLEALKECIKTLDYAMTFEQEERLTLLIEVTNKKE